MRVHIKEVRRCRNGAYGNFLLRGRDSSLITVSMELNKSVAEYSATVFHELMHLWMTLMRLKGFRCTNKKEHEFIYAAEAYIIRKAKMHLRRRKK